MPIFTIQYFHGQFSSLNAGGRYNLLLQHLRQHVESFLKSLTGPGGGAETKARVAFSGIT